MDGFLILLTNLSSKVFLKYNYQYFVYYKYSTILVVLYL